MSGGADSLGLAWLARRWAQARGFVIEAIIVDHGLRAEATAEADRARAALASFGVAATILTLAVARGPGLAARARDARAAAVARHCAARGVVHVMLGHHAGDQAETVAMRLLRGSGPAGLAAMPPVRETAEVRWLRPLLPVPAGRLRATLREAGLGWAEDPSNADPATLRARLRTRRADPEGDAPSTLRAVEAAAARGRARADAERHAAEWLAEHATLYEAGFAVLHRDDPPPEALASVLRAVGGGRYPPATAAVARWRSDPRAGTLAGVVIGPAGRLGPGWLLTRERAAMAGAVAASAGMIWDGRFRLRQPLFSDGTLGAADFRPAATRRRWPARVERTLPGLRDADGTPDPAGADRIEWGGAAICPAGFGAMSLAGC